MIETILTWVITEPKNNALNLEISNFYNVEIEIGFGKGDFLIEQSQRNSDNLFVAFEIKPHCFKLVKNKLLELGITNVLIFNCDGINFIREMIPDNLIDRLHIYFPQYSSVYESEAIITKKSMIEFDRILKPNSQLRIVTDIKMTFSIAIQNLDKSLYDLKEWVPSNLFSRELLVNSEWGSKFIEEDNLYYINALKNTL